MSATTEPAPETLPPELPLNRNARPSAWPWVMCLLGIDYFSSLAYQPSATFEVAGLLGPFATVVVVLMTLGGALPVYFYVAGRSCHGLGSTWLLERLVHGWVGKTLVLLLLGFAATDFVMVKTLSLADAAEHVIHNEYQPWQDALHNLATSSKDLSRQFVGELVTGFFNERLVTTILLGVLGFVFWWILRNGFNRNVVVVAVPIVGMYLLLNGIIIVSGLGYLLDNPERLQQWHEQVVAGDWQLQSDTLLPGHGTFTIIVLCLLFFPHLSLGLSGFEMSLIVMPQVKGTDCDDPNLPAGRIRNTRKVLIAAALVMSVYLLSSVLVTTLLIPPNELLADGRAYNRALAYLAHGGELAGGVPGTDINPLFGPLFGMVYDLTAIFLLCLAGMSVMAGLQAFLPQFLLRYGMQLKWAHTWGVLFMLFAGINLAVTLWFRASVDAQRGAYATGVLVLIANACAVSAIDRWRRGGFWLFRVPWLFGPVALFFTGLTVAFLVQNPSGLPIAACFTAIIFVTAVVSRAVRVRELRTIGFEFIDEKSKQLWDELKYLDFPVLVPHRPGRNERADREVSIRREHQLAPDVTIVFMEIHVEDASDFFQDLRVEVFREDNRHVIKVSRCVSVAHAIASVALEMSRCSKPPALHFGWPDMSLLEASWSYLVFGAGNIPWRVRELLHREAPDPEHLPRVIVG